MTTDATDATAYVFNWSFRVGHQTIKLPGVTSAKANGVVATALRANGGETRDSIRVFEALNVPVAVINEYLPDYQPKRRSDTHIDIGTKWARLIVQSALQRELRDQYLKSLGLEGWMFAAADITDVSGAVSSCRDLLGTLLELLKDDRVYYNAKNVYELRVRRVFEAAGLGEDAIAKHKSLFPAKNALTLGSSFSIATTIPKPLNAETAAIREIAQFAGDKEQKAAMELLIDSGASSLQQAIAQAREQMVDEMMSLVAEQLNKLTSVEGKTLTLAARQKLDQQATRVEALLNMLESLNSGGELSDTARAMQSVTSKLQTGHTVELSDRLAEIRRELSGDTDTEQLDDNGQGHLAVGRWTMI
ncbi:MAG: hypothetical protein AAFO83_00110 [Cyanobacteria bacterium J06607_13]